MAINCFTINITDHGRNPDLVLVDKMARKAIKQQPAPANKCDGLLICILHNFHFAIGEGGIIATDNLFK